MAADTAGTGRGGGPDSDSDSNSDRELKQEEEELEVASGQQFSIAASDHNSFIIVAIMMMNKVSNC